MLVLSHGKLALGIDQGVLTVSAGPGTSSGHVWDPGLPNAVVNDLTAGHRFTAPHSCRPRQLKVDATERQP
jgi:hypothetical protein